VSKLPREFFSRCTLRVAQELLGKILVFNNQRIIITETEAYIGIDDPACHAARGKTPRTSVMFGPAGFSYVYLIYGMYHCLNIVTEKINFPAAVLIRGGINLDTDVLIDGPGKLCRALGITKQHSCMDLMIEDNFYVQDSTILLPYETTPRIGIKVGLDKLWRYYHQSAVSKKVK